MQIKKITGQSRRDFYAIYKCEHCGFEEEGSGYDDSYFHNEIIPNKICKSCGKKGDTPSSQATNPDWMQY